MIEILLGATVLGLGFATLVGLFFADDWLVEHKKISLFDILGWVIIGLICIGMFIASSWAIGAEILGTELPW